MKSTLALLVVLLFAASASAQPAPRQALAVQIAAEPVEPAGIRVALTFRNPNAVDMRLWAGFTPQDGYPRGDWFRIAADGKPVSYVGPLPNRRFPDAGVFQVLKPGQVLTAAMNLAGLYNLPRRTPITLRFEAYDPSVTDQAVSLLVSNEVRVTLP